MYEFKLADLGEGVHEAEVLNWHVQPGDTIVLAVTDPTTEAGREVTVTLGEHPAQAGKAYLGIHFGGFPMRQMGDFCHQCW